MALSPSPRGPALATDRHGRLLALLRLVGAAIFVIWLPRWFDPALADPAPWRWAANALPFVLLWLLMWALARRPLTAAAVVAAVATAWYTANRLKLQYLETPLMPGDVHALSQLASSPSLFLRYLGSDGLMLLVPVVLLVALAWWEPVPRHRARVPRLLMIGAVVATFATVPSGGPPWSWLHADRRDAEVWLPRNAAAELGSVGYFFHLAQSSWDGPRPPDPTVLGAFDAQFSAAVAARLAAPPPDPLPDLIIVQSESFFDPAHLRGIDAGVHTPHLQRLAARSLHGQLRVPAFGGLTTRTEFELLTSVPLATMPAVQYPYQGLVHRPIRALPWSLKALGYRTRAVHPYERRFYRRDRVYPLLGFDSFHSISEFDHDDHHGYYVSDAALNRRIIELLEADSPSLVFAVTMENHGPWDHERPLDAQALAAIDVPAGLDAAAAQELRAFLHHTHRADAALGELADWVAARERPTLLLFFGDHLPALHAVFDQLGFVDGRHPVEQTLPWLLFDSRRDHVTEPLSLASHDLAALLLDTAGLHHDPHLVALTLLREADIDQAARARLAEHLTRERFFAAVEAPVSHRNDRQWHAQVSDWGPRDAEVHVRGEPTGHAFWVEFEQPLPRGVWLSLGGRRMDVSRVSDTRLHARLSDPMYEGLLATPGRVLLQAIEPLSTAALTIGEFEIRPRAVRARLADGRQARRLCPIEDWGPSSSDRAGSANPQGDDGLGVWVSASCMPHDARMSADGAELPTTVRAGGLATALLPSSLLATAPERIRLTLLVDDESIEVGELELLPAAE